MRKGVLVFAVIAFALTGGTIYFVNTWMKAERSRLAAAQQKKVDEPRETGVFVLVAAKDLPAGHLITVSDLRWQSWPDKSVPQQYVVKKEAGSTDIPASYVGTVVRRARCSLMPFASAVVSTLPRAVIRITRGGSRRSEIAFSNVSPSSPGM